MAVKCVISGPVDIYAGYGQRALDFIKTLIEIKPDWDIKILSQRWGNCRSGYLADHNEVDIINRIIPKLTEQPDVWIQITVPNEFQAIGKVNIGVTAAMETTVCDPSWIHGCNRMNFIITSSEHGKRSLTNSKYINNETKQPLELKVPVLVLFEGVDKKRYRYGQNYKKLFGEGEISDWNYLCIGHWMQGDLGEDRKNIGYTVKAFLETFLDQKDAPGLVLKTCRATSSVMDRYEILKRLYTIREWVQTENPGKSLPEVYLLHGDLSDEDMNALYNDNRIKAMVSLTKGEGFGRPLLEFAAIGKPVMCSGWSGQLDFLDRKHTAFVGGQLTQVHPSAAVKNMILQEAAWFTPDDTTVKTAFREVYKNYDKWKELAYQQARTIRKDFSLDAMSKKLKEILDNYMPELTNIECDFIIPEE